MLINNANISLLFHHRSNPQISYFSLQVSNEDSSNVTSTIDIGDEERTEADKIVDCIDFGELCNDFECISSPALESTARRLARIFSTKMPFPLLSTHRTHGRALGYS